MTSWLVPSPSDAGSTRNTIGRRTRGLGWVQATDDARQRLSTATLNSRLRRLPGASEEVGGRSLLTTTYDGRARAEGKKSWLDLDGGDGSSERASERARA